MIRKNFVNSEWGVVEEKGKRENEKGPEITRYDLQARRYQPTNSLSVNRCLSSLLFFLFSLFIFLSCQSLSIPEYAVPPNALPLDKEATAYVTAYVKQAFPIIKLIPEEALESSEMAMLMDRTEYFCAAFFPSESKKKLQLVSYGNYPDTRIKMALGANKDWKKNKAGWYSDSEKTSVYVTSKLAFASLWESAPNNPVSSSRIDFPDGFDKAAPLSCWLENPGRKIDDALDKMNIPLKIPVQRIFASFYTEDDLYRVRLKLKFSNAREARTVIGLINMARLFINSEQGSDPSRKMLLDLFFAKVPEQDDIYVNINPPLLNDNGMRLLFNFLFSGLN